MSVQNLHRNMIISLNFAGLVSSTFLRDEYLVFHISLHYLKNQNMEIRYVSTSMGMLVILVKLAMSPITNPLSYARII